MKSKLSFHAIRALLIPFWQDTSGIILPYVTLMLGVIVGFSLLAVDGARFMSLQTQMQAAADALALAGARELNQVSGAQSRAVKAMANAYAASSTPNTLSGMGTAPVLSYTSTFYSALPAASSGFTGTAATGDADAKFVAVSVTAVTIPTIFPVKFLLPSANNSFSTGARAAAGFTAAAYCNISPVFICNPYETAGMTDAQATDALHAALDTSDTRYDPAVLRRQFRMDRTSTSPGHFGWLTPPDNCNNTACLKQWIAYANPPACYTSTNVNMATGNKQPLERAFDVRFDIFNPNTIKTPSDTYAPALNVRKGYLPDSKKNWCNTAQASPYLTTPILHTTGNTTGSGSGQKTITNVPATDIAKIAVGQMITGSTIAANTSVTAINTTSRTVTMSANATANGSGVALSFKWETSGLPQDKQWTGLCSSGTCYQGNGDWNCLDYWTINHSGAAPSGCTNSSPTMSRYQIYRYEIANALINDWSGNAQPNITGKSGNGESGAPLCAAASNVSGIDSTTGGTDRRTIFMAAVNCLAQSANIGGGSNAAIPAAGFIKYFMTQPYSADNTYLYGEMVGFVGAGDHATILNQVQLYR